MINFITCTVCIFLNLIFIFWFEKIRIFHLIIDKPDNFRKFHKKPTSLAGGVILMINILFFFIVYLIYKKSLLDEIIFVSVTELNFFICSCLLIFLIGFFDDKFNFTPLIKFFLLLSVIILLLYFNPNSRLETIRLSFIKNEINLAQYSTLFTLFCFLVFINSFNMFDGINLQASSYTLFIFITFAIYLKISLLIKILLIFIIAFKYLNFRNKSFLGDSGSLLVAFIISFIFIKLFNYNIINYSDEIFIYMMLPGIDMIRLFFQRIKMKRNPFSFDRLHLHHLLLKKFSYTKSILIINLLILFPIMLNFFIANKLYIILITIFAYTLTIFKIKKI